MVFVVCTAVTTAWCNSMSAAGEMPTPGGWTMSMAWMRMPGQTWAGATASFVGMWVVMMAAMMLPSLAPVLWRYRLSLRTIRDARRGRLTTLVGLGYFFVWTLLGLAVFPMGAAMATIEMEQPALARAVPIAAGWVVVVAGAVQFTKWKANHLTSCREAPWRDSARIGSRRQGVEAGHASRTPLRAQLCQPDGGPVGCRCHGPARNGRNYCGNHR